MSEPVTSAAQRPARPARRPGSGMTIAGAVLSVAGLIVWLFSALQAHGEARSYTGSQPPPIYVDVTSGHSYSISIPRGLDAAAGKIAVGSLSCSITPSGAVPSHLQVLTESNDKAINQIATFVAPVSGPVHVACNGLGSVYVDDADGQFDTAGLLVLLATVLLAVGVAVLLSGLAAAQRRAAALRDERYVAAYPAG